jgi:FtsP/CotA-like multicopper oxidase with cupredoxin domain
MGMSWVPDRPGNWLFHCHIGFHVVPGAATLDPDNMTGHDRMSGDPRRHMAGLVLGISVRAPRGWSAPARVEPRRLRLLVQEGIRRGRAERTLGFVLQQGAIPAIDSVEIPGSTLFLTRGQRTDVVVVNRLRETAAIHWHGIELESFSDGVAGWSGMGRSIAASIEPGDSFTARLTLPRSGTFIYHSHMNDLEQLTSGLYGAIVVLEPGERFDPTTDHLFILSWDGTQDPAHFLVNGDSLPPPLELAADMRHRLRFINSGAANRFPFSIRQDTALVSWRALAKDGADLPAAQALARPALQSIDVGETYDFEWSPPRGEYRLVLGDPARPLWQRRIVVRGPR